MAIFPITFIVPIDSHDGPAGSGLVAKISELHFELIPTPKVALQFAHLPANSTVSVTCSPAKDIEATLEFADELTTGHIGPFRISPLEWWKAPSR